MKTTRFLLILFIVCSLYGFSSNHFTDNNSSNSVLSGLLNKRVSDNSLYSYLAFSHWLQSIETKNASNNDAIDKYWYSSVIENIKKEEYYISYNDRIFAYQSPNRANNYRLTYYKDGFNVKPKQTKIPLFDEGDKSINEMDKKYETIEDWNITMRFHSFGKREQMKIFKGDNLTTVKNTAYTEDDNLRINYTNDEKGMRQDFVIKQKPEGAGNVKLCVNVTTRLKVITGTTGVVFKDSNGKEVMKYSSLKIWDSEGKELKGWFEKNSNKSFNIIVDDEFSSYPITIDPLSSTENWLKTGSTGSYFGLDVSTAGDVNGDGYSDVIIAAVAWDYKGRVFVYHGSSSGLSSIHDWSAQSDQDYSRFGCDVSTAGDVNGDGYSDIIIGANEYDNGQADEGRAFVYYGSSSGLDTDANWVAECNQDSAWFGLSVSTAGDVNGDGYTDVIVGANLYNNGEYKEGRVFVYQGSSTGLSLTSNWTAESNVEKATFGVSVSNAGDVNSDGYSDIIIGANGYNNLGRVFVYLGTSSGLESSAGWYAENDQLDSEFGYSVSTAGDVNGDGYSDIIVGDHRHNDNYNNEGMAFVWHGSSSGLGVAGTPSNADWSSSEGGSAGGFFGNSVSTVGDVNLDGYSDVIVGAFYCENGQDDEGLAYVYYGSTVGLSSSADWIGECDVEDSHFGSSVSTAGDVNGDGYSDVLIGASNYYSGTNNVGAAFVYHSFTNGLNTASNWSKESEQVLAYLGYSVSTAGDVNGDGYSDVIVGAYSYDNGENDEGRVFVYFGSETGLSTTANWTAEGNQAGAWFGKSVSTAGDVNGDGYSDILIGADMYDNGECNEGRAFVYRGSSSGISISPSWTAESNQSNSFYGFSVSTAGDVNGDGYSDVIVSAYSYDNGETNEGRAYVYHGSSSGLSTSANWTVESNQADALFGYSVSTAGDVNGDGFSDVIVGAHYYTNGQDDEGAAFVYHGSSTGLNTSSDWSEESNQSEAYFGISVSTAGDVNGDGYSDVIIGAYEYTHIQSNEGKAYVYHGSSSGLLSYTSWTEQINQSSARLGRSVSSAGDVNGDGYSDVIVGAPFYSSGGYTYKGAAFVYHGSSSGLNTSADWVGEIDFAYAYLGQSVFTAGDVNGDGYSDVIVGANGYTNGQSNEGSVFLYYGNESGSMDIKPRQWRENLTTPVVPPLKSRSGSSVGLGIFGNSYFGRTKVKIQFEVQPMGTAFGTGEGTGITETSTWTDVGTSGTQINQLISGLTDKTLYKWRMRIKYDPSDAPPQPYSRWVYNVNSPNGPLVSSIQVSGDDNPLPVSFLSFTSKVEKNDVILKWSTLSELNNQGFSVQRKKDDNSSKDWVEVGFVKGNGTTNQIHDYQFTDKNLQKGRFEYRLKQVDYNNNYEHHYLGAPVSIGVPAKFELSQNYPNSFNPTTKIDFMLPIDGRVSLKVYDITGRIITTLINNEYRTADYYTVEFNGSNFASGVYFYQLITEKNIATKKMLLIK